MTFLYPVFPLLICIVLLLIKKVNFKEIINGVFWGIISFLLLTIIDIILLPIIGSASINIASMSKGSIFAFIYYFFVAALPEELCKYGSIKFSSKKEKNSIIINAILVSVTFIAIESFGYASTMGVNLSVTRVLHTWHLFYQVIMALFLVKSVNTTSSKNTVLNILALAVPILCHSLHNWLVGINEIVDYIFMAVSILTYFFTIYLILKLDVKKEEPKVRFLVLKVVVIILSLLFMILLHSQNNNVKLNQSQHITEENIELKVISYETFESDNIISSGSYFKVKVEIKNNNDVIYKINTYNLSIVDNLNKNKSYLSIHEFSDSLNEVAPGETVVGYLYFDDDGYDYNYLIFAAGELNDKENYTFTIK